MNPNVPRRRSSLLKIMRQAEPTPAKLEMEKKFLALTNGNQSTEYRHLNYLLKCNYLC